MSNTCKIMTFESKSGTLPSALRQCAAWLEAVFPTVAVLDVTTKYENDGWIVTVYYEGGMV